LSRVSGDNFSEKSPNPLITLLTKSASMLPNSPIFNVDSLLKRIDNVLDLIAHFFRFNVVISFEYDVKRTVSHKRLDFGQFDVCSNKPCAVCMAETICPKALVLQIILFQQLIPLVSKLIYSHKIACFVVEKDIGRVFAFIAQKMAGCQAFLYFS